MSQPPASLEMISEGPTVGGTASSAARVCLANIASQAEFWAQSTSLPPAPVSRLVGTHHRFQHAGFLARKGRPCTKVCHPTLP